MRTSRIAAWRHLVAGGGIGGNERLTAATGIVIALLATLEGVTVLAIRPLLSMHVFVGMLLIPPVVLKLGAVGYRFVRYYTGSPSYVSKGPPRLLLRILVGPVLVATTVVLLGSGVALVVTGVHEGPLVGLHKASFVVWFGAIALHFLAYALRLPRLVAADWIRGLGLPGRFLRYVLLTVALAGGLVLGAATLPALHSWTSRGFGHDRGYDDNAYSPSAFSRSTARAALLASFAGNAAPSTSASASRQRAAARK
jgi:hypothetical protein